MPSFFRPKSGDTLSPPTKDKKRFRWLSRPGSPAPSSRVPSPTPPESPGAPYPPVAQSSLSVLGPSLFSASNATLEQPDSPLPWKPFTLNASVLRDLHEWNKIHENSEDRLPNVLRGVVEKVRQKVATTMDSKGVQIALDAIPNGTIPAGNIVKGLVWITVLCLNIPERKKAAYNFAIQTAEHLNAMADAFGTAPPGDYLTQLCMDDLKPFCDTANEICEWAYKQVVGSSYKKLSCLLITIQTSKGAFDDQPQAEFKQKLDNATRSFLTISTIRTIHAISALDGGVVELLNYNKRTARLARINKKFGNLIATQYQSKDQDKERCHEVTRASVLEKLDSWIRASSNEEFVDRCWWMTGIAGVGKTAIAISTVQYLLDRQPLSTKEDNTVGSVDEAPILYGQYFCNHKLDTSKLRCLFPTLAIQIAETSPAAAHIIDTALKNTPSLAHVFNFKQAKEIFLKPLCHLAKASPSITFVIVIDGVDEFQPALGMPPSSIYQEVTTVLVKVAEELPINARLAA
ncbi:Vegetative incompatibility protein HET-E-1 [Mycena venus]|uniref:Vegetative incompatibility protein HET-E-1 n=1 Tax=Mycena venus TaxID=2733690 RepID=A0A8H7D125_9AGAR|nr:Vegetative incompatibility protein HET-E-1 [Mycena venus]